MRKLRKDSIQCYNCKTNIDLTWEDGSSPEIATCPKCNAQFNVGTYLSARSQYSNSAKWTIILSLALFGFMVFQMAI